MSLKGQVNKNKEAFYQAVRQHAFSGMVNHAGVLEGSEKLPGWVCGIRYGETDPAGEANASDGCWLVDVMEHRYFGVPEEGSEGFHKDCRLCSTTFYRSNVVIVPMMYSDVVIQQDPVTKIEYVTEVSFADTVKFLPENLIVLGARKLEDRSFDGDYSLKTDIHELSNEPKREERTYTEYRPKSIETTAHDIEHESKIKLETEKLLIDIDGNSTINMSEGNIELNGDQYCAVLYEKLQSLLTKFMQYVATATAAGSPLSTAANISALINEIQTIKSETIKIGK